MNFEYYLYQFLLKNQKAQLADFGVFRLTKESAKIDAENAIIIPPKEEVLLQFSDVGADDSFAVFVAQETNQDLETIKVTLAKTISLWKAKLENEAYLELQNIGQFKLDKNKNVIKIDEDQAEIFGLEEINLQKIKKSKSPKNKDFAIVASLIWVFVVLMVSGGILFYYFGDLEMIFGKDSQIPKKEMIIKTQPKKVDLKKDTLKIDSTKINPNAEI